MIPGISTYRGLAPRRGGALPVPPSGDIPLGTVTLHNTSGTATTPRARFGMAWEKTTFPTGYRIAAKREGSETLLPFAGLPSPNKWGDNSVKGSADGGVVIEDSATIAGNGSQVYEIVAVPGTQVASGFNPWAWIAASADDLTVGISARTGSATGAMANLSYSLKTAATITTRREIIADSERFMRVKCWQKLAGEEHLICEFHVDFWLDGDGDPVALEAATVMAQHWPVANPFGVSQTKERQNYTATVAWGATTLDNRSALAHAYHCRWASLRTADDAQHARKHWIDLGSTPMPTLRTQYDDDALTAMMKAGAIPPLRTDIAWADDTSYPTTYTPLAANGHSTAISGTGGYAGRGCWSNMDSRLIGLQSRSASAAVKAWRQSRCGAQAGLAVYLHHRDYREVGGDAANTIIPTPFRRITSGTQSYAGMATPIVYALNIVSNAAPYSTMTYTAPTGGTGGLTGYDNAHATNYSAPMAWLEGETYLYDAAVGLAQYTSLFQNWNGTGADAGRVFTSNADRRAITGAPSDASADNRYGTTPIWVQERDIPWAFAQYASVAFAQRDSAVESAYIKNMLKNTDQWLTDSWAFLPTGHRSAGGAFFRFVSHHAQWMQAWIAMYAYQLHRSVDYLTVNGRGYTGIEEAGMLAGRLLISRYRYNPYASVWFNSIASTDALWLDPVGGQESSGIVTCTIASDVWSITANSYFGVTVANGDRIRISRLTISNAASQTAPTGMNYTDLYYVVNVSGSTFQVSSTAGGSPITGLTNRTVDCGVTLAWMQTTPIGPNEVNYWPPDDSYAPIADAMMEQMIGDEHEDITTGIRDDWRAFMASWNPTSWATWAYDGSKLL